MLYDRWRQIAQTHRNDTALRDFASGQDWTFARLAAEAGSWSPRFSVPTDNPAARGIGLQPATQFPQGNDAGFILAVLRAWRANQIICPLEPGQAPPPLVGARVLASHPNFPKIVHLKTTSATTGAARVVAFTAEQLAADAENVVATMGLRRDWANLGVISLAHSYGFSNLVTPLLLHGIPLILAPAPLPETVRRAAALAEFITLPAVPAMWRAWQDADSIPPNVKLAISAGAPLPLALEQEVFTNRGLKIHNFYGASECGGIAYDATETPRTDAACVGAPMKNVSLSVAGDGCLEVRSRAVAEACLEDGGWREKDGNSPVPNSQPSTTCPATAVINPQQLLGDGRFHTSDLAEISDGQIFLRGRAGDQINVAGRKVSPETIERVLLRHPQVLECLVFGVPSPGTRVGERNEEIVAVVMNRLAGTLAPPVSGGATLPTSREEILRQFVLETLPAWQTPRHWLFVEALQTNPRGKISRAEWRERWLAK